VIVAIIPARNEGASLAATITGLQTQHRQPDRIIVVCNNCTDNGLTLSVAQSMGVEVMDCPNNPHKKAGALNLALEKTLPGLDNDDLVLMTDADTTLDPDFTRNAARRLESHRTPCAAVGSVFTGRPGGGILGQVERNEYQRFLDQVSRRRKKRALVLSGTATMIRVDALRKVAQAAELGLLPGHEGYVYNTNSQTEDHYLTLTLHALHLKTASPGDCRVTTDVMGNLKALWHQRIRWQQGTVDDLRAYGWRKGVTREMITRQVIQGSLILIELGYVAYLTWGINLAGVAFINPAHQPLWLAAGGVLGAERAWSVRHGGWKAMAVAAVLVVELAMDLFRQFVFLAALWRSWRRRETEWVAT
jgi:biofilm PGA synthesis N-glycosyltransferase PgaC